MRHLLHLAFVRACHLCLKSSPSGHTARPGLHTLQQLTLRTPVVTHRVGAAAASIACSMPGLKDGPIPISTCVDINSPIYRTSHWTGVVLLSLLRLLLLLRKLLLWRWLDGFHRPHIGCRCTECTSRVLNDSLTWADSCICSGGKCPLTNRVDS